MDLLELAKKTGADKPPYYLELYQNLFENIRLKKLNFLEIGIGEGGSTFMWSQYFPNSRVVAMDILDRAHVVPEGFEWYQGNQSNPKHMAPMMDRNYDIIIDDGSHVDWDMQFTLGLLYPLVNSGGFYFIEDLGTRRPNRGRWRRSRRKNNCPKTREVFERLIDGGEITSPALSEHQMKYIKRNTTKFQIENRIVILCKVCEVFG